MFKLPSKASLRRWMSVLPISTGLPKQMRDMIQSKAKLMNESGKVCTLTMDEVSLKANLQYDQKTDKVIGVEDYGNGKRSEKIATSALVFMAIGLKIETVRSGIKFPKVAKRTKHHTRKSLVYVQGKKNNLPV